MNKPISPTILVLDTSGTTCRVGLIKNNAVTDRQESAAMQQGKLVLPMISAVLEQNKITLAALDAIAYVAGPGSFTGLRIGASVVQAFSFAHHLPVIALDLDVAQTIPTISELLQWAVTKFERGEVLSASEAHPTYPTSVGDKIQLTSRSP